MQHAQICLDVVHGRLHLDLLHFGLGGAESELELERLLQAQLGDVVGGQDGPVGDQLGAVKQCGCSLDS